MRCTDRHRAWAFGLLLPTLVACTPPAPPPAPPAPEPLRAAPAPAPEPAPDGRRVPLPLPTAMNTLKELRLRVAQRLVAAHPDTSYTGPAPDPLLAIPVLEIELNADGSVRRIVVLRQPREARDTTQLAIDAVRKAAPYGDVSRLPKPWKFSETFLFDEQRRFKPRTLEP